MSSLNETSSTAGSNDGDNGANRAPFNPAPRDEWTLLCQGAEAKVWKLVGNGGQPWICKERFSKAYRHPALDERLTKTRCRSEAKILEKCSKRSDEIRVPKVVRVDPPLLFMECLEGQTLKEYLKKLPLSPKDSIDLNELSESEQQVRTTKFADAIDSIAKAVGKNVGALHNLSIVHGDLTTANMLLLGERNIEEEKQQQEISIRLALIDFGLAKLAANTEEQAVDLYVLERALQSTHPELPESFFSTLLESYSITTAKSQLSSSSGSKKRSQSTLQRLEQVRLRGRKRECFG